MLRGIALAAVSAATLVCGEAAAATYTVTATGTITGITAYRDGDFLPDPTGSAAIGDPISVSVSYDTAGAIASRRRTIAEFQLPGAAVTVTIGDFRSSFVVSRPSDATIELWNDNEVSRFLIDAQRIRLFSNMVTSTSPLPIDLPDGPKYQLIYLQGFDYTASTFASTFLSDVLPFSSFGARDFYYTLFDVPRDVSINVSADLTSTTISIVPEPAAWAFLILGAGATGTGLRRRRRGHTPGAHVQPSSGTPGRARRSGLEPGGFRDA